MRDAYISPPPPRRKTPAVTAGGGKREAAARAAERDERGREVEWWAPGERNVLPPPLPLQHLLPRPVVFVQRVSPTSFLLRLSIYCIIDCARAFYLFPIHSSFAFKRPVHLYSAPTPLLAILLCLARDHANTS